MTDTNTPPEHTPYSDSAHTNVGPGWQDLLVRLEEALTHLGAQYELIQLKEKFGSLRYYITVAEGTDPAMNWAIHALIDATEAESARTCEDCGKRATVRGIFGWQRAVCDDHFVTRYTERKAQRAAWALRDEERVAASKITVTDAPS